MDSDWLEVIDWDSRVVGWCPRSETNTPTYFAINCKQRPGEYAQPWFPPWGSDPRLSR